MPWDIMPTASGVSDLQLDSFSSSGLDASVGHHSRNVQLRNISLTELIVEIGVFEGAANRATSH